MEIKNLKFKIKNSQGGFAALFVAILIMAVVFSIGTSIFTLTYGEQKIIKDITNSSKAYYAAEGGLEDAIFRIKNFLSYSPGYNLSVGNSQAAVTITSDGDSRMIESLGQRQDIARRLQAVVQTSITSAAFHYGVQVGYLGLEINDKSQVMGNVYSNGSIAAKPQTLITGDVLVAGGTGPNPDQAQISQTEDLLVRDVASRQDSAQSFTPSITADPRKISLYIKKVGNPGDATVRILPDNGGVPDRAGSLASGQLNSSAVTTNYSWVDVALNVNDSLTQGQKYWIVFDNNANNASKYFIIGGAADSNYLFGTFIYSQNWNASNPVWTQPPQGSRDSAFRVYLGEINTKIDGAEIGGSVHANTIIDSVIAGDAYYQTISGSTVGGTNFPGSQDPYPQNMPLSDGQIADFKAEGDMGGTCGISQGCDESGDYTLDHGDTGVLGPIKVLGDFTVQNSAQLTISGTIHVVGRLILKNQCKLKLSSSYGAKSGIIVVDGTVDINNQCVFSGSGNPESYPMIITTNIGIAGPPALRIDDSGSGAILYASQGALELNNHAGVKEAVGQKLILNNQAVVTYESGLANVNFSSGPGGSWQVDSWQEIE